jgi:hypothetical protein
MIAFYITIPLMLVAIAVAVVPLVLAMMHDDSFDAIDDARALGIDWTSPLERERPFDGELARVA